MIFFTFNLLKFSRKIIIGVIFYLAPSHEIQKRNSQYLKGMYLLIIFISVSIIMTVRYFNII